MNIIDTVLYHLEGGCGAFLILGGILGFILFAIIAIIKKKAKYWVIALLCFLIGLVVFGYRSTVTYGFTSADDYYWDE